MADFLESNRLRAVAQEILNNASNNLMKVGESLQVDIDKGRAVSIDTLLSYANAQTALGEALIRLADSYARLG